MGTDDAMLVERIGSKGACGRRRLLLILKLRHQKIYHGQNWILHERKGRGTAMIRVGQGFDVHQLVEGRKCIIGGVTIPYEKGLLGHSDADVLLHAISDAILGALGLGISASIFRIRMQSLRMRIA